MNLSKCPMPVPFQAQYYAESMRMLCGISDHRVVTRSAYAPVQTYGYMCQHKKNRKVNKKNAITMQLARVICRGLKQCV